MAAMSTFKSMVVVTIDKVYRNFLVSKQNNAIGLKTTKAKWRGALMTFETKEATYTVMHNA